MRLSDIYRKLLNRWKKFRLSPIRVFCLHHVCAEYDVESMNRGDWMQIDEFKAKVLSLQQDGVEFISLSNAREKLSNDKFRSHRYAILTFDDGYASLKEILPWLEGQKIPVTLFINGKYLDGKSYRKNLKEKYLSKEELFALTSSLIEIGSHGWEHTDALRMSANEFEQYIVQNIYILFKHPRYIPFHAYTWGRHNELTDSILQSKNIIPVYIDGMKNYNNQYIIHRELL